MLVDLRDRLFERIEEDPSRSILALLDPSRPVATTHPLHIARLLTRAITPEMVVVQRDDRMSNPDLHPRLVVLRKPQDRGYPDEELLELTVECALRRRSSINGAYVCGWLIVERSPVAVASHIRRNIVVNGGSVGRQRVIPLFEPHRLMIASQLASQNWLNRWLEGIASWLLIDVSGRLRELRPARKEALLDAVSNEQGLWLAQSRVKQAREVLLGMTKADQVIPEDGEIRVDRSLCAAYREGLTETEDVIFFAINHMVLPPQWHRHPSVRVCIAQAISGETALTDGMASLPDDVLDELSLADPGAVIPRNLQWSN